MLGINPDGLEIAVRKGLRTIQLLVLKRDACDPKRNKKAWEKWDHKCQKACTRVEKLMEELHRHDPETAVEITKLLRGPNSPDLDPAAETTVLPQVEEGEE